MCWIEEVQFIWGVVAEWKIFSLGGGGGVMIDSCEE